MWLLPKRIFRRNRSVRRFSKGAGIPARVRRPGFQPGYLLAIQVVTCSFPSTPIANFILLYLGMINAYPG